MRKRFRTTGGTYQDGKRMASNYSDSVVFTSVNPERDVSETIALAGFAEILIAAFVASRSGMTEHNDG